jgi:hypothetical protein
VTLRTSEGVHHERWRATDHTLERDVVLVCFPSESQVAAAALDAARRAAGVEDPRLVRVLDVGTDGPVSFIVEEPLTGSVPMSHLLQGGGLPSEEVRRLVGEAASALEKARHRGLHHLALSPSTILRLPDGLVKLRGLATEAALLDTDSASDDLASRLDAVGLVRIIYAGLTARWPASAPEAAWPVPHVGLEPAPTMVGGVAAPSEIAVGVPADLDLICRQTLSNDRGPVTPGDLANQIAPWSREAPATDATTGLGLGRVARPSGSSTRVMPTVDPRVPYDAGAPYDQYASRADATGYPSSPHGGRGDEAPGAAAGGAAGGAAATKTAAGLSAAGAAAAGVAGAIGDRVGSFARAAADKAAAKAAERRAAHQDFEGEDVPLVEALERGDAGLEPPVPMLGHAVPEAPSGTQSRIALAIVAALVLVALVIGVQNVMKIGQHDGTRPAAAPATSASATPKPSTSTTPAPTTTSEEPTSEAPPAPISITGASGFDPEGNENQGDGKANLAFDGDPGTAWESRWFGTPNYNGGRSGVGLVLDLDQAATIKEVVLTLPAAQDVTVYAADGASLDGAQEIGKVNDESGTITLKAPDGLKPANTVIVWVTKAAPAEAPNHYRAQVSEVVVR